MNFENIVISSRVTVICISYVITVKISRLFLVSVERIVLNRKLTLQTVLYLRTDVTNTIFGMGP